MTTDLPLVSVLIPVFDEAERIRGCLDAVLGQDWPADRLEIIVVDSGSTDGTVAAADEVLGGRPDVASTTVANPGQGRSSNLNEALRRAHGTVACRVDARSIVPPDYVRRCVALLDDPSRAVVGGSQRTVSSGTTPEQRGVARALDNRYAMGMARYRRGGPSGPADTVYLGAFRTAQLREAGGWDPALSVNEDFDLNSRMSRFGVIWYDADLKVGYLARTSVSSLASQYWGFGRWKVRYLRARGTRPRPRQLVGLAVVPAALGGALVVASLPGRGKVAAAGLGVAAAFAVEGHGSKGSAPLRVRLWSLLACGAIVGGWSSGAWAELVSGRGDGADEAG